MERPPCCDNGGGVGVKKGPWTPEEDIVLVSYVQQHGPGNWRSVPENTGARTEPRRTAPPRTLDNGGAQTVARSFDAVGGGGTERRTPSSATRCGSQATATGSDDGKDLADGGANPGRRRSIAAPKRRLDAAQLPATAATSPADRYRRRRWAAIASYLPQRTDNDIKNYWNTHLKKKVMKRLHTQPATTDSSQPSTASNLPAAVSPTNYYYSPSIITQQHNLQGMHTMSISYPNTAAAYGSAPTSSTATASPVSDLVQTWAMMRPSPPATAANYHQITMSMQEYREDRGEAAVVDCKQNQPVFIDDNKPSSSSGMLEAAPALMMGSSSAATFSLLEDWLLDHYYKTAYHRRPVFSSQAVR